MRKAAESQSVIGTEDTGECVVWVMPQGCWRVQTGHRTGDPERTARTRGKGCQMRIKSWLQWGKGSRKGISRLKISNVEQFYMWQGSEYSHLCWNLFINLEKRWKFSEVIILRKWGSQWTKGHQIGIGVTQDNSRDWREGTGGRESATVLRQGGDIWKHTDEALMDKEF